jgi:hypothetical protein
MLHDTFSRTGDAEMRGQTDEVGASLIKKRRPSGCPEQPCGLELGNSITSLVRLGFEALAAFLAAHGSYSLLTGKTAPPK